jgi:Fe-S cluster assembly protein SufD
MMLFSPETLPDKRAEDYKYSDLLKLLRGFEYRAAPSAPVVIADTQTIIDDVVLTGGVWQSRDLSYDVQAGGDATIVRLVSGAGALTDAVTVQMRAGATARIVHVQVGAGTVRTNLNVVMNAADARVEIYGMQLLKTGAHGDFTVVVRHMAPECISRKIVRTVVDANATGVFQGLIHVAPHAQKTDAAQSSKAVLLSPQAVMNTKPELEIFADDVACAHGATVGMLDANQLFYAMARGLDEQTARAMLTRAFLLSGLPGLPDDMCAQIEQLIDEAQYD